MMDVEKYASSKLYMFFEWSFKLIIWNLLGLLVILIIAGGPLYGFFYIQDQHSISDINILDNEVTISLKNGEINSVGTYIEYGKPTEIMIEDNKLYFNIGEKRIKVNNENRIKNIETLEFVDGKLIGYYMDKSFDFGFIYGSEVDINSSYINSYKEVVISLANGTSINYGVKIDIDSILPGVLVFISIVLAIFTFIPIFTTIFSLIKIFGEGGHGGTLVLFFDRLWDNFKALYKIELIVVPLLSLMCYGLFAYYYIIDNSVNAPFWITLSYNAILVCIIGFVLFILNIPFTVGYFRMKPMSIVKFTLSMAFKNILYSFLYVILLILPILACFLLNILIPIWFLLGLSLPLFIEYFINAKKYRYIVNNLEEINNENDDIYNLNENKN